MINITKLPGYPEFTKECKYFFCKNPDVYGQDWSGSEEYIIASDFPEDVLRSKYPEIMHALSPYLFCDAACGEAIAAGMRNTQKFQKRESIYTHYSLDEDFEQNLADQENLSCSYSNEITEMRIIIEEAFRCCTQTEKERIIKYYFGGLPMAEIANGVSAKNVRLAIQAGLKKMKKFLS